MFVTGGTGMLGSHAAALLRGRGHPVRALHRTGADTRFLRGLGCDLIPGDLRRPDDLRALGDAMAGCVAVVHAAAVIYAKLPWPEVRAVNVEGTGAILRAAAGAGVRRVVWFSTASVHGDPWPRVDEASPLDAPLRPFELYARSKREAEAASGALARELGVDVRVLRPSAIYGERDRLFVPRLLEILAYPVHPVLGAGRAPIPAVYAGNVADAALAALGAPAADGACTVYELGADHPVTALQMNAALARGLGVRFRPVRVPAPLVRLGAACGETLGLRIPGAEELPLRRTARLALGPNPYGSERIRRELGWRPAFSLAQALERTSAWVASERGRR